MPGFLKLLWFTCQYVCLYPPPRALRIGDVILIMCDWLNKFYSFSASQLLYMTLVIDKMDGHGLGNTASHESLPRRLG